MSKATSPSCACNPTQVENLPHILLYCQLYDSIRQESIPKFLEMNRKILEITENENLLIISILDPLSSKLPPSVTSGWSSVGDVYELARKYCRRIHLKREKMYTDLDNTP